MKAFKPFFDFGVSSPVHFVKVVMTSAPTPGYTPRMVWSFLNIKNGADVINLDVVNEKAMCRE
jgi:hypothetical protein